MLEYDTILFSKYIVSILENETKEIYDSDIACFF